MTAVFCSFSAIGFLSDIFAFGATRAPMLAASVVFSGLVAVGYALCALSGRRGLRWIPVIVGLHIGFAFLFKRVAPTPPAPVALDAAQLQAMHDRLTLDGVGCIVGITTSYALFVTFISTEGQRYLQVHTEMRLAERIHRALVPAVGAELGGVELRGWSVPTGQVGGDLVDIVPVEGGWVAYVADVAGHGVRSGVVTGMVKSAIRMQLRSVSRADALLEDLNETLVPLVEPNMFVTASCVHAGPARSLTLAAAGHPPLLHFRRASGDVVEHNTPNVALGLFPAQQFTTLPIHAGEGDVLLLLTDGLIEVFDRRDQEFGLAGVSRVLRDHAAEPLDAIGAAIRNAALAHGDQRDDQTLLLLRVSGAGLRLDKHVDP